MTPGILSFVLPVWALPWLAVTGAGALIVGARRIGTTLLAVPIIQWVIIPGLEPFLETLPAWVRAGIMVTTALLLLNSVLTLLFGPNVAGHVVGTYIVRFLDFLFLGPLRLLRDALKATLR